MHYLYKITNMLNNKIYIGQTVRPTQRWTEHKRNAANPTQIIGHAIKKHGNENFIFEVIAQSKTYEDANFMEEQLIIQYDCMAKNGKGYNVSLGGMTSPKSDEWKAYMSEVMKNQPKRFGADNPFFGKTHSPEVLAKIAPTQFGAKEPWNKGKSGYTIGHYKNRLSDEERQARRKLVTAKYRAKIKAQKELI